MISMNIIICGLAATGKSSLARMIAEFYGLEYISSSTLLKGMLGYNYTKKPDFWDKEGRNLLKEKEKEAREASHILDKKQLELAKEGNKIFDSWVMGWLYKGKAIKILIFASEEVRAERMSKRDSLPKKKCLEFLRKRDKMNYSFFKKLYKIDILKDRSPFDLVINTDYLGEQEVYEFVKSYLDQAIKKIKK